MAPSPSPSIELRLPNVGRHTGAQMVYKLVDHLGPYGCPDHDYTTQFRTILLSSRAPTQLLKASTNSSLIPFNSTASSLVSFVLSNTLSMLSLSSFGLQCFTS